MTESHEPPIDNSIEPLPGQLWRWNFTVGDGTWVYQRVTTEARETWIIGGYHFMKRGDFFTMVTTDDPGPAAMNLPNFNNLGEPIIDPPKRWHVVLTNGILIWLEHDHLEQAVLVTDV